MNKNMENGIDLLKKHTVGKVILLNNSDILEFSSLRNQAISIFSEDIKLGKSCYFDFENQPKLYYKNFTKICNKLKKLQKPSKGLFVTDNWFNAFWGRLFDNIIIVDDNPNKIKLNDCQKYLKYASKEANFIILTPQELIYIFKELVKKND